MTQAAPESRDPGLVARLALLLGGSLFALLVAASAAPPLLPGDPPEPEVDVALELGDRVVGVLPSGGTHVLSFEAVAGTVFTVRAVRTGGFMLVGLRLFDPQGNLLVDERESVLDIKHAAIVRRTLTLTGSYRLEVVDLVGQTGGSYKLRTDGERDRKHVTLVTVDGQRAPPPIRVAGVAGEVMQRIELRSLKPKGLFKLVAGLPANLMPQVATFGLVDGGALDLDDKTKVSANGRRVVVRNVELPALGDYNLHIDGALDSVGYARVKLRRAALKSGWKTHKLP